MLIKKLHNFSNNMILASLTIFTSLSFILMVLFYCQNYMDKSSNIFFVAAFIFITILIGYILIKIRTDNKKINFIIVFSLIIIFSIISIIWIKINPTVQLSDYGNFWDRMLDYKIGSPIYETDNDYFSKYAYQTFFFIYVFGVVKLFGYHIFAIQLLNVVYQCITIAITYLISLKLFNNIKIARLSVLLLIINLDWFALNVETSNQYLGSMLILISFYLIIQNKKYNYVFAGITLGLGCLIRPIGPVILAGILVFTLLYTLIIDKDYKRTFKMIITLFIYFLVFITSSLCIKSLGINQYGLSNNDTDWKFLTGLNYKSSGTYSPDLEAYIDPQKTRATMKKVEQKKIKEEVTELNKNHSWTKLFINKFKILWSGRTMATDGSNFGLNHSIDNFKRINFIAYMGSITLIIFSWIGSLILYRKNFSEYLFLLILPLLAFSIVQLFIEVQGRYRIEFIPIITIVGALGLFHTIQFTKKILKISHGSVNKKY